jgi:hypothetical protein
MKQFYGHRRKSRKETMKVLAMRVLQASTIEIKKLFENYLFPGLSLQLTMCFFGLIRVFSFSADCSALAWRWDGIMKNKKK